MRKLFVTSALLFGFASAAFSQTTAKPAPANSPACNQPLADEIAMIDMPGNSFEPIPSADGCWIFVSITRAPEGKQAGVEVLHRAGGKISLERLAPVGAGVTGMVLTHDGKTLIGSQDDGVVFLDTARLISGQGDPVLGKFDDGPGAGTTYVNVTKDDRFLFVSDERTATITVINLEKARASGYSANAIAGKIPVGQLPIALTFSPDERYLYTTSEAAAEGWGWPVACTAENSGSDVLKNPEGAVVVVDVTRAKTDPTNSVIAKIPAGCSAVRLVISPKGDRAYVTARNSNALLAFDTAKFISDAAHARIGTVPVGVAPVGVAVVNHGTQVVVTNSNRFGGRGANDKQYLTVIDAAKVTSGAGAVLGTIPAGGFPRELRVTSDGRTLLLTNFASSSLEIIDLARLKLQTPGK
jgi:DNA-binding beta-propeller fold protein YncE